MECNILLEFQAVMVTFSITSVILFEPGFSSLYSTHTKYANRGDMIKYMV